MSSAYQVAIAQINPTLGNLEKNFQIHLQTIKKCQGKAQLVIFPELSLTGYYLKDQAPSVALKLSDPMVQNLVKETKNLSIIFGMVEKDDSGSFFLSQIFCENQEIKHVHRKIYLPTYGIFDDQRFFAKGSEAKVFDLGGIKASMLICEDAYHYPAPYMLALRGAKLIIINSCSPAVGAAQKELLSVQRWHDLCKSYSLLFGIYTIFANRVGVEDGIQFSGASCLVSPEGSILQQAKTLEEDLLFFELDFNEINRTRIHLPLLRDEQLDWTLNELRNIRELKNDSSH